MVVVVVVGTASQVRTRFETAMSSSVAPTAITNFNVMLVAFPWLFTKASKAIVFVLECVMLVL